MTLLTGQGNTKCPLPVNTVINFFCFIAEPFKNAAKQFVRYIFPERVSGNVYTGLDKSTEPVGNTSPACHCAYPLQYLQEVYGARVSAIPHGYANFLIRCSVFRKWMGGIRSMMVW